MNRPGCECVAELLPSGDDRAFCSKCGQEYVRTSPRVRYVPEHGPDAVEFTVRLYPEIVAVDDGQKPETD